MRPRLKKALIVVTSDPRKDGRVAEAVRIAAGVGGWEKVSVELCLCGAARLALGELTDELVNSEVFASYLPLLLEGDSRLLVLHEADEHSEPNPVARGVTVTQLAAMGQEADFVLRF